MKRLIILRSVLFLIVALLTFSKTSITLADNGDDVIWGKNFLEVSTLDQKKEQKKLTTLIKKYDAIQENYKQVELESRGLEKEIKEIQRKIRDILKRQREFDKKFGKVHTEFMRLSEIRKRDSADQEILEKYKRKRTEALSLYRKIMKLERESHKTRKELFNAERTYKEKIKEQERAQKSRDKKLGPITKKITLLVKKLKKKIEEHYSKEDQKTGKPSGQSRMADLLEQSNIIIEQAKSKLLDLMKLEVDSSDKPQKFFLTKEDLGTLYSDAFRLMNKHLNLSGLSPQEKDKFIDEFNKKMSDQVYSTIQKPILPARLDPNDPDFISKCKDNLPSYVSKFIDEEDVEHVEEKRRVACLNLQIKEDVKEILAKGMGKCKPFPLKDFLRGVADDRKKNKKESEDSFKKRHRQELKRKFENPEDNKYSEIFQKIDGTLGKIKKLQEDYGNGPLVRKHSAQMANYILPILKYQQDCYRQRKLQYSVANRVIHDIAKKPNLFQKIWRGMLGQESADIGLKKNPYCQDLTRLQLSRLHGPRDHIKCNPKLGVSNDFIDKMRKTFGKVDQKLKMKYNRERDNELLFQKLREYSVLKLARNYIKKRFPRGVSRKNSDEKNYLAVKKSLDSIGCGRLRDCSIVKDEEGCIKGLSKKNYNDFIKNQIEASDDGKRNHNYKGVVQKKKEMKLDKHHKTYKKHKKIYEDIFKPMKEISDLCTKDLSPTQLGTMATPENFAGYRQVQIEKFFGRKNLASKIMAERDGPLTKYCKKGYYPQKVCDDFKILKKTVQRVTKAYKGDSGLISKLKEAAKMASSTARMVLKDSKGYKLITKHLCHFQNFYKTASDTAYKAQTGKAKDKYLTKRAKFLGENPELKVHEKNRDLSEPNSIHGLKNSKEYVKLTDKFLDTTMEELRKLCENDFREQKIMEDVLKSYDKESYKRLVKWKGWTPRHKVLRETILDLAKQPDVVSHVLFDYPHLAERLCRIHNYKRVKNTRRQVFLTSLAVLSVAVPFAAPAFPWITAGLLVVDVGLGTHDIVSCFQEARDTQKKYIAGMRSYEDLDQAEKKLIMSVVTNLPGLVVAGVQGVRALKRLNMAYKSSKDLAKSFKAIQSARTYSGFKKTRFGKNISLEEYHALKKFIGKRNPTLLAMKYKRASIKQLMRQGPVSDDIARAVARRKRRLRLSEKLLDKNKRWHYDNIQDGAIDLYKMRTGKGASASSEKMAALATGARKNNCVGASSAMVADTYGIKVDSIDDIHRWSYIQKKAKGIRPESILLPDDSVKWFAKKGIRAKSYFLKGKPKKIIRLLKSNKPMVGFMKGGRFGRGHAIAVDGIEIIKGKQYVVFRDPLGKTMRSSNKLPLGEFVEHVDGLVVPKVK